MVSREKLPRKEFSKLDLFQIQLYSETVNNGYYCGEQFGLGALMLLSDVMWELHFG